MFLYMIKIFVAKKSDTDTNEVLKLFLKILKLYYIIDNV